MKRLLVMTVGQTHSGKSTFGRMLASRLGNACVIDQDNHAEFINTYYQVLLPKHGPNVLKYSVSETIIDYAIAHTEMLLIFCNAFRTYSGRSKLLNKFRAHGFTTVLVNFDISDEVLAARVAETQRSTAIFRSASSFEEVLARQQAETGKGDTVPPRADEANYFFNLKNNEEAQTVATQLALITAESS